MHLIECGSCARELSANAFPTHPEGSRCTHERRTCKRCWSQWLDAQVKSKTGDQIARAQCNNVLSQSEIRALAKAETYQRSAEANSDLADFPSDADRRRSYLDSEVKAVLSANSVFRWCRRPGCKSGQEHTEGDIVRCVECHHKVCITCDVDWHEGETCESYQERVAPTSSQPEESQAEEAASAKAVARISEMCPKCVSTIEKHGGCDHMTCKMVTMIAPDAVGMLELTIAQCRPEICRICLADYAKILRCGNGAHQRSCAYHTGNLPQPGHGPSNGSPEEEEIVT